MFAYIVLFVGGLIGGWFVHNNAAIPGWGVTLGGFAMSICFLFNVLCLFLPSYMSEILEDFSDLGSVYLAPIGSIMVISLIYFFCRHKLGGSDIWFYFLIGTVVTGLLSTVVLKMKE